jgi:hypothetical protein
MRRQCTFSLSLGSLPDRQEQDNNISVNATDFIRRTSYEIHSDNKHIDTDAEVDETFEKDDFTDVISPLREKKRLNENSSDEFVTKRIKSRAISVQVSLEDRDENIDWTNLRNNFFVGVPKVYNLCSCRNHSCKNN